jgi:hypothetical protein
MENEKEHTPLVLMKPINDNCFQLLITSLIKFGTIVFHNNGNCTYLVCNNAFL